MVKYDDEVYRMVGQDRMAQSIIKSSLYRCQKAGIPSHMERLPEVTEEMVERAKSHVSGHIHLMRRSTPGYYQNLTEILSANDAMLCYIFSDYDIFGRYGNQALKDELKRINFRLGTNLGEDVIGTNAAVMAMRSPKGIWVIGEDHYVDVLKPYACYAYQIHGRYDQMGIGMLLTRVENLSPQIVSLFKFIESTELIVTTGQATKDTAIKDTIVQQAYNQEAADNMILLVDNLGYITYANDVFYKTFHMDPRTTINQELSRLFPGLEFVKSCMQYGRNISKKRVSLGGNRAGESLYYVDCTPIKHDGQWQAATVTLYKSPAKESSASNNRLSPKYCMEDLLGVSKSFVELKEFAQRIADTNTPVLIQGESGTGKELFAHAIHSSSKRRDKPFVSINCAAIPRDLIGSELFGYVGGAFTGANRAGAKGKFELANGGTLFLDEIGEMPLEMQSVLLRVLEENAVTRIGGDKPIPISVRLITATNRDLQAYIAEGKFRADLYFRLNVINLNMIPLRNRKEDIPVLAEAFTKRYAQENGVHINGITQDALYALMEYSWPGNVRELRNTIERGVVTSNSGLIELKHLPSDISLLNLDAPEQEKDSGEPERSLGSRFLQQRREMAMKLMQELHGNKSMVAKRMGISRSTLYRILNQEK